MPRPRALVRALLLSSLSAVLGGLSTTAAAQTCTIDGAATQQTIDGFGFSTAWSGRLSTAQGDVLFGTGSGQLGFSLLRVRIDPAQAWSDETSNASVAHAHGAKVLGTPWSPPTSMKTNGNTVHGSLLTSQYGAYATYLAKAATSMGLDYVSIQNEPDYDPTWEGCTWTPEALHTFVLNNASAIGKPVVMPEGTDFKDTLSDPTLNDPAAASRVTVVAGHFYNEGNTSNGNYVHQNAISKGKRVWMTEHYLSGTDIATCMSVARELSDAMNNQFNAYYWWWMEAGGDGNFITGTTPMKNGYVLGQFARFVRPGMARVTATYSPRANVYVTAYTGGGKLVIIAVNAGTTSVSQPFALQNVAVTSLDAVRTSASENMAQLSAQSVSGGAFTAALPAQSVTTYVGTAGGATTYTLSVSKTGSGSGTVTSSTGGISCGTGCSATLPSGTAVTLTASAAAGSTFGGWSGACVGTGTCVVTMTANQSVSASFTLPSSSSSSSSSSGGGAGVFLNAGGAAAGSYGADQYFSGGSTYTNSNTIDTSQLGGNAPPAAVFQSERYGTFSYTIPGLAAGSPYTVTLYFAETYVTSAGARVFSVSANGTTVLGSFDIYAAAGGQNKAVARSFTATASGSGQLVLQFVAGTQSPKVNAISVIAGGSSSSSSGGSSSSSSSSSGGGSSSSSSSSSSGGSSGGGTCKAVTGGQSGNFNTTGAVCFTVTGTVNGWGCSNTDGRTVSVNGTATACGKMPLPGGSPYTFSFGAGSYGWASFYWW